jgi:DNA/RNA endonuclease G (NUC1)
MHLIRAVVLGLVLALSFALARATDFKPEAIDNSYQHDKYGTMPRDLVRQFRAYIVSFDSADDDDGDGKPDMRGIPEWVSYEMRRVPRKLKTGPKRPSPWITDPELFKAGVAPSDDTYAFSKAFLKQNKNWYERGHLTAKVHAWRLGAAADWNTHTVLNAVPQRKAFNAGIWKDLEEKTAKWADNFGTVWIIAGPIFKDRKPSKTLGEEGEMKIAIPDFLFKIVIKQRLETDRIDVLAFVYTQECDDCTSQKGPFDHRKYLVSVREIETRTGLRFFTILSASDREAILKRPKATELWD